MNRACCLNLTCFSLLSLFSWSLLSLWTMRLDCLKDVTSTSTATATSKPFSGKGATSLCPAGVAPVSFLILGFSYKEIVRETITLFMTILENRWQENISPFARKQRTWSAWISAAVMFALCVPKQTFLSRLQLFSRPALLCLQPCACWFGSLCDCGSCWRFLITLIFAGFVVIVYLVNFVVGGFLRTSRDLTWWPYQKRCMLP